MSIYYPAGVTGFEPEIAGYDERDIIISVECDHQDSELAEVATYYGDLLAVEWMRSRSELVTTWTCPICGTEHEDSRDPSEDGL